MYNLWHVSKKFYNDILTMITIYKLTICKLNFLIISSVLKDFSIITEFSKLLMQKFSCIMFIQVNEHRLVIFKSPILEVIKCGEIFLE